MLCSCSQIRWAYKNIYRSVSRLYVHLSIYLSIYLSILHNRSVTGGRCHAAATPLVDHSEQRPQSSHDGGVRGRGVAAACAASSRTDVQWLSISFARRLQCPVPELAPVAACHVTIQALSVRPAGRPAEISQQLAYAGPGCSDLKSWTICGVTPCCGWSSYRYAAIGSVGFFDKKYRNIDRINWRTRDFTDIVLDRGGSLTLPVWLTCDNIVDLFSRMCVWLYCICCFLFFFLFLFVSFCLSCTSCTVQ